MCAFYRLLQELGIGSYYVIYFQNVLVSISQFQKGRGRLSIGQAERRLS
jgi:hypothetical protein